VDEERQNEERQNEERHNEERHNEERHNEERHNEERQDILNIMIGRLKCKIILLVLFKLIKIYSIINVIY